MPWAPPKHCPAGHPPYSGARCPACAAARRQSSEQRAKAAAYDAGRGSAASRGYDADWRRCRKMFLAQHPICSHPGCGKPATDVDHIVSPKDRPDLRLSWSNLRPFCHSHHSARTARDQGFARRQGG